MFPGSISLQLQLIAYLLFFLQALIDVPLGEDSEGRLICYNVLIKTLCDNADRATALGQDPGPLVEHIDGMLLRMQRENLWPNTRTYTGMLRSCVAGGNGRRGSMKDRALQLLQEMETKAFFPPTTESGTQEDSRLDGTSQTCHILPVHVAFVVQACVLAEDLPLATSIYAEYCRHFGRQVRRRSSPCLCAASMHLQPYNVSNVCCVRRTSR